MSGTVDGEPGPGTSATPAEGNGAREGADDHATATFEISELQAMPMRSLLDLAERENVQAAIGASKQELLFEVLKHRASEMGLGLGEGVLDVLPDGFGFLRGRRHGYRAGQDDIYVSPSQIRRLSLKRGHWITGPVRPPRDSERFLALLHVDTINGGSVRDLRRRVPFENLTPILPHRPLVLEHAGCPASARTVDLLAPMAQGQRVLLLAPPQSGRTRLLTEIAAAVASNHQDMHIVVLLIDERPEDVTDVTRSLPVRDGVEVVASTFDEPPQRHVELAELMLDRTRRMIEAGRHVLLVVDSLSALARAYNVERPHTGKIIAPGVDAAALHPPKRLFGAARCTEEAGTLTVLATALTDTGAAIDDVLAADLRGKANCEIVLDPREAELHSYPAFDVGRTGTRREDCLLPRAMAERLHRLRAQLLAEPPPRRLARLDALLAMTGDNATLLATLGG